MIIELENSAEHAENINIINDGEVVVYGSGSEQFNRVSEGWRNMLAGAHEMPAFGVSLDYETRKSTSVGLWLEFEFKEALEHNGMPFEKLLVKVDKGYSGFNIIRYNNECGYEGRCFYFDLVGKNMDNFYEILTNLSNL